MALTPGLAPDSLSNIVLRSGLSGISYGQPADGTVFVPLGHLGGGPLVESWPEHPELLFAAVHVDAAGALERAARDVFARSLEAAHAQGTPHFVRMWNFVGSINDLDEGRERYQLFCAGRHDAFEAAGRGGTDLPAASAVGMPGRGLITCFLAAREPGTQIENPRQLSAYRYPPQYGPKSPSFARATLWGTTLFVSGTSSIVGHATLHAGDVEAQLDETLRNLEIVIARGIPGGTLANVVTAKTYLRRESDTALVSRRLSPLFRSNLIVQADICRSDLLIEIEVVAR